MKDEALALAKAWFERNTYGDEAVEVYEAIKQALAAQPAPVQEPFDHQQAASIALRESMNRSNAIAKNTVPTLQKRPQNCGTGYCSCVECVMEPAPAPMAHIVGEIDHNSKVWTPAQRQWVGLTDEEVRKVNKEVWGYVSADHSRMRGYARAIEAKLREKNNGITEKGQP
jgi:hypothetical protein